MRDEPQKTDEASYSQVYAYQKPKRYGFLEDHARLITFLICVALFLAVFWPIAMPEGRDVYSNRAQLPYMTANDLFYLAKLKSGISESLLTQYVHDRVQTTYEVYYFIPVEPHYEALVVFGRDTKLLLLFHISNTETDQKIDALQDDVKAFLNVK